jgi:hypothetical protein
MAGIEQGEHQVAAYIAGAAGDEKSCHGAPVSKKESASFLKKRSKKLLSVGADRWHHSGA